MTFVDFIPLSGRVGLTCESWCMNCRFGYSTFFSHDETASGWWIRWRDWCTHQCYWRVFCSSPAKVCAPVITNEAFAWRRWPINQKHNLSQDCMNKDWFTGAICWALVLRITIKPLVTRVWSHIFAPPSCPGIKSISIAHIDWWTDWSRNTMKGIQAQQGWWIKYKCWDKVDCPSRSAKMNLFSTGGVKGGYVASLLMQVR